MVGNIFDLVWVRWDRLWVRTGTIIRTQMKNNTMADRSNLDKGSILDEKYELDQGSRTQ